MRLLPVFTSVFGVAFGVYLVLYHEKLAGLTVELQLAKVTKVDKRFHAMFLKYVGLGAIIMALLRLLTMIQP